MKVLTNTYSNVRLLIICSLLTIASLQVCAQPEYQLGYGGQFLYGHYQHTYSFYDVYQGLDVTDSIEGNVLGVGLVYSFKVINQIAEKGFIAGTTYPMLGISPGAGESGFCLNVPINVEYMWGEDSYDNLFAGFGLNGFFRHSLQFPGQLGLNLSAGVNHSINSGGLTARFSYSRGIISAKHLVHSNYQDLSLNSNILSLSIIYIY